MSMYDLAHRLVKEIKQSDQYQRYLELREKIMEDESTRDMLKNYQQQQIKLQSKQLSGEKLTDEEKEELQNLQDIIELNSEVKEYLEAEQRMNVLLNDMQKIIFSDLKLGLFEEEDI
jgi:cell fate (sporulation/competence/biofilm development) regulator YlbF (YheA/YmcA/DUF963 family)